MKFSVVIPVYNVMSYLRECLDSILAQTFTDWEAICVDDGSTDGSVEILDEYAAKDCRFRVIHAKNGGVSRARNIGIAAATGDYVTFLDGDDLYERGWLAEARRILDESSVDLLRMKPVLFADGKVPSFKCCYEYRTFRDDEVQRWGWRTYSKYGWAWVSFVRRSCLSMMTEPFPGGMVFMEDNVFSLGLMGWCRSAAQSEYIGYAYRQRIASVCAQKRPATYIERLFDEMFALMSKYQDPDKIAIQDMLYRAILGWRKFNLFSQASCCGVAEKLRKAERYGVFDLRTMPLRWRLGFLLLIRFRFCGVIDILLLVRECILCVRHDL